MVVHVMLATFTLQERPAQLPIEGSSIKLTEIGDFGRVRKKRPWVAEHLHTGIDIQRPGNNYANEPILAIAFGRIISKRTDGPYAQLIIEHEREGQFYWTLYEHIAGILVDLGDRVEPGKPLARFFNRDELHRYGWQFNHFHFEIIKKPPVKIIPDERNPQRHFRSFTLACFDEPQLRNCFYDPIKFLREL